MPTQVVEGPVSGQCSGGGKDPVMHLPRGVTLILFDCYPARALNGQGYSLLSKYLCSREA